MKKLVYIDKAVEDPRRDDLSFGSITASEEGYRLRRYLDNRTVIEALGRVCEVRTYDRLSSATDALLEGDAEAYGPFAVLITNVPTCGSAKSLALEQGMWVREIMDRLEGEERRKALAEAWANRDRLVERIYAGSLYCIQRLRAVFPEMKIIAYTGAPTAICARCLDLGVSRVIHRGRHDLDMEIEEIREAVEKQP